MAEGGTFGSASELLVRKLIQARKEQGLSLEEVSEITRIKRDHLENIESENLRFLPSVYVYAFLKEYALALGVTDDELLENCRAELSIPTDARARQDADATCDEQPEARGPRLGGLFDAIRSGDGGGVRPAVLVGGGVALLVVLLVIVFLVFGGGSGENADETAAAGSSDVEAVEEAAAGVSATEIPADSLADTPVQESAEASLAVKAQDWAKNVAFLPESQDSPYRNILVVRIVSDLTWVKVIADDGDKVYPGGQFKAGEVLRYEAKKKFWVNIGRPPFVELYLNGEKVPPMEKRTIVLGQE